MPLSLPNLDDRSYAELVDEARSLIPSLSPEWTDHNPSDPGIALIELLAWLTEMVLYSANRVPDAHYTTFLNLLRDSRDTQPLSGDLERDIQQTMLGLRQRYRATTTDDYEYLALRSWPETPQARALLGQGTIRRARCVPQRNLEASTAAARAARAANHVSLVVVTDSATARPNDAAIVRTALWRFLDERRLLTTRHHVVEAGYVAVELRAKLRLRNNIDVSAVQKQALAVVRAFFDPLTGGPDRTGWPFGRNVYVSELYQLLDALPSVEYVEDVQIATPTLAAPNQSRYQRTATNQIVGIVLETNELVTMNVTESSFTVTI